MHEKSTSILLPSLFRLQKPSSYPWMVACVTIFAPRALAYAEEIQSLSTVHTLLEEDFECAVSMLLHYLIHHALGKPESAYS